MSVKSKNGHLAARVPIALAALFDDRTPAQAQHVWQRVPSLAATLRGHQAPVGGTVIVAPRAQRPSRPAVRDLYAALTSGCAVIC